MQVDRAVVIDSDGCVAAEDDLRGATAPARRDGRQDVQSAASLARASLVERAANAVERELLIIDAEIRGDLQLTAGIDDRAAAGNADRLAERVVAEDLDRALADGRAALKRVVARKGERAGADFHHVHDAGEVRVLVDDVLDERTAAARQVTGHATLRGRQQSLLLAGEGAGEADDEAIGDARQIVDRYAAADVGNAGQAIQRV